MGRALLNYAPDEHRKPYEAAAGPLLPGRRLDGGKVHPLRLGAHAHVRLTAKQVGARDGATPGEAWHWKADRPLTR